MSTYFISDIHLHADSKHQAELLLDFLRTHGQHADAIYILGDLFAIWLGDDLDEPYSLELSAALKHIAALGVPLYFMRGNRDFLVGQKFCRASGCTLLPDPCKVFLYGEQVLLTHGDLLCTLDKRYQKFRRVVQNPILKTLFLALPIRLRKKLGLWIKGKSKHPADPKAYDTAQNTVDAWFKKFGVRTMIHGHTHLPAVHAGAGVQRIVLGDWTPNSAKILVVEPGSYELQDLCQEIPATAPAPQAWPG